MVCIKKEMDHMMQDLKKNNMRDKWILVKDKLPEFSWTKYEL